MENTENTTQTQTTDAAPGADKSPVATQDNSGQKVTSATESAALNTQAETSPKPDAKEVARQAFANRSDKREKKASEELAEMRKELDALKAERAKTAAETKPVTPSLLDDPEGWAKAKEQEWRDTAANEFKAREQQFHYGQASETAASWLLSRSHLKQDKALLDETLKIAREKYAHIAAYDGARDPQTAARLAYLDACAAKGMTPDMDGFKQAGFDGTKGAATSGVRTSSPADGKRIFQRGEVEKYVFGVKAGSPEFFARQAEVEEARREGRIK